MDEDDEPFVDDVLAGAVLEDPEVPVMVLVVALVVVVAPAVVVAAVAPLLLMPFPLPPFSPVFFMLIAVCGGRRIQ
jgi:hypothetical protein